MEDQELQDIRQRLNRMDCKLDQMNVRVNEELVTKDELKRVVGNRPKDEPFLNWWMRTGLPITITFLVLFLLVLFGISLKSCKGNEGYYDREIRTDR